MKKNQKLVPLSAIDDRLERFEEAVETYADTDRDIFPNGGHDYVIKTRSGFNPGTGRAQYTLEQPEAERQEPGHIPVYFFRKGRETEWESGIFQEDLIAIMIHRQTAMQQVFPCEQSEKIIEHLWAVLHLLDERATDRKKRGVLGKHKK